MAKLLSNTRVYGTASIDTSLTVGVVNPVVSTSNTTGSLVVGGGVGISGNLVVSGALTTNTTSLIMCAGLPSNNTLPSGANTVVPLVSQYDPNGWWKTSSNTAIPGVAGWYHVSAQVWWNSSNNNTGQINSQVQKNASTASINQANNINITTTAGLTTTHSTLVYCNGSTDAIGLTAYTNATSQQIAPGTITGGLSSGTFLQIYFVR